MRYDSLWKLLISLALAGLTLLVYASCFQHPFISYDDPEYVAENGYVQAGLTVDGVRWAFTTFACGNWHPLTWLSLQLDASLYNWHPLAWLSPQLDASLHGGAQAGAFHRTNVLLHTANALLLFLVLGRMTGSVPRSAVVAALFALHPLHVESVAWVAERKDVLSALFWMLTLAAYLYYVRRPGPGRYLLVLLSFGLGLLAKPIVVTLPFVLLLLDYWPLRRLQVAGPANPVSALETGFLTSTPKNPVSKAETGLGMAILEKVPLLALALGSCLVTVLAQRHGNAIASFERFPLTARVANALLAYVAYLGKMVWPMHLTVFYPHSGATVFMAQALAAGGLLGVLTVLVLGPGRRWPYLAVGWLWYLGTLVPVIGLVQVGGQGMADRYTYLPLIGLFVLATWAAADLALAWRWSGGYVIGAATVAVIACAVHSRIQVGYWRSNLHLWEHAVAVTNKNLLAHINLGTYYYERGQFSAARKEFEEAVAINPQLVEPHFRLASALAGLGLSAPASAEYRQALVLEPSYAPAHNNLGNLLRDLGQLEDAVAEYRRAIALRPSPGTCVNLGMVLWDLGRLAEAAGEYRQAIALDPDQAQAHNNLGIVFMELGRRDEAVQEFRRAIALDAQSPEPYTNLGRVLQEDGRLEEAAALYHQIVERGDKQAGSLLHFCERLQPLRARVPGLFAGRDQPADNDQRLMFAYLCRQRYERRYALAARLYREAFRVDPRRAEESANRFNAAGAYAAASCGQGLDGAQFSDEERAQLGRQALTWLQAELAVWAQQAHRNSPQARAAARQILRTWQQDPCLAAVRDAARLAKLPSRESASWQKLWQEVTAVLATARTPPSPLVVSH